MGVGGEREKKRMKGEQEGSRGKERVRDTLFESSKKGQKNKNTTREQTREF